MLHTVFVIIFVQQLYHRLLNYHHFNYLSLLTTAFARLHESTSKCFQELQHFLQTRTTNKNVQQESREAYGTAHKVL